MYLCYTLTPEGDTSEYSDVCPFMSVKITLVLVLRVWEGSECTHATLHPVSYLRRGMERGEINVTVSRVYSGLTFLLFVFKLCASMLQIYTS